MLVEGYFLLGKTGKVTFVIPRTWRVLTYAVIETESTPRSVDELVDEALRKPIGTAPLSQLIKPGDRIALVVDDCTRPTPRKAILACLFRHFAEYGVSREQVDIVFALGTHRPMTDEEVTGALGSELKAQVRYSNHDAWAADLVPIGKLPAAGEIRINPLVAAADFRVTVGSILPHPMNGFGGGAKNIFPGVGNFEAIRDHHNALMAADGVAFGKIKDNPFLHEVNQASQLARLDFIINAVYNAREEVKAVVAGDFIKAYEYGVAISLKEYAVEITEQADITITSTFPYEEGPQLVKPLCVAAEVTKEGGWVILYAGRIAGGRLPEGLLEAFDAAYAQASKCLDMKELVLSCMREGRLLAPNAAMDFNCALDLTLLHLSRVKVILVSPDADKAQTARLGFLHARSLEKAFELVETKQQQPTVNILPSGGLTVPLVN
jgi:nickel-dependent lactate racemase